MMHIRKWAVSLCLLALAACSIEPPQGIVPVKSFQLEPYLGIWHEVARMDHSFERGLTQVSAEYSLNDDGSVRVLNRGWNASQEKWKEAVGRAVFVNGSDEGRLKVSFFGPFYGGYNIIEYNHAEYTMICGSDRTYLWILSRDVKLNPIILNRLVAKAKALGFDVDKLIYPD